MHYLIDGYNLLFLLFKDQEIELEKQRDSLISLIINKDIKGKVLIVFDGDQEEESQYYIHEKFRIVYTAKNETADQYIIQKIAYFKKQGPYLLISSDKRLTSVATYEGAYHLSAESFLKYLNSNNLRNPLSNKADSKPNMDTEYQIERLNRIFEKKLMNKDSE
jgi:predicted RNA-binding protein with PIN domain